MKHITDRYNMYYSYAPTKLNAQIHMAAVYQAIFAPLLGLFWMLFFSILRVGGCPACSLVSLLPSLCPVSPLRRPLTEEESLRVSRRLLMGLGQVQWLLWATVHALASAEL